MFKVNNIFVSGIFVVNVERISHLVLVFLFVNFEHTIANWEKVSLGQNQLSSEALTTFSWSLSTFSPHCLLVFYLITWNLSGLVFSEHFGLSCQRFWLYFHIWDKRREFWVVLPRRNYEVDSTYVAFIFRI